MDFVDRVHLETMIAYTTINIITFTFITLSRHTDGKQKYDPGAAVDDLCKSLVMSKQKSQKIKVMIEAKWVTVEVQG